MAESYSYIFYIQSFQLLAVLHTYSLFLYCLVFFMYLVNWHMNNTEKFQECLDLSERIW